MDIKGCQPWTVGNCGQRRRWGGRTGCGWVWEGEALAGSRPASCALRGCFLGASAAPVRVLQFPPFLPPRKVKSERPWPCIVPKSCSAQPPFTHSCYLTHSCSAQVSPSHSFPLATPSPAAVRQRRRQQHVGRHACTQLIPTFPKCALKYSSALPHM